MSSAMPSALPSAVTGPELVVPQVPLRELAPWALFFGLLLMIVIFFVSADQAVLDLPVGNAVHEWFHDGRHLLGYPCH